ncbi:DUF6252 family protein [candidate division KSB1 bacterium]|nr:DUF6252 family protein [candidate division KSB1 bacterium]
MNTKFKAPLLFAPGLAAFIAICSSCDRNPSSSQISIDPAIIGVWAKHSSSVVEKMPAQRIDGIEIHEDGAVTLLGVETSSGKLIEYDSPIRPNSKIIFAQKGKFRIEVPGVGLSIGGTFEGNYSASASEICFYKPDSSYLPVLNGKYERSQLGEIVTTPIVSEFYVKIDSNSFFNAKVWPYPSAYASYWFSADSACLQLQAISNNNKEWLSIFIRGFVGIGSYTLGTESASWASYRVTSGDVVFSIFTNQPNAGIVEIKSFDLLNNTCSGTFSFRIDQVNFTNGVFTVPIYK